MPGNMRLLTGSEAPTEDTPPSTRPSSAASNSTSNSGPQRSTSMDSLNTSSSEKPSGEELIPTRFSRPAPKVNVTANMQFVKTKPAALYKSAREQIEKADAVKCLRKTTLYEEEEEWQSTPLPQVTALPEEDWQSNLDKWKSSRRKRNEEVLGRVIEAKKYEQETHTPTRRKSKTFSEMQEEKTKRGRRYNLVVHDDDNDDLSGLGLSSAAKSPTQESLDEVESKDIDNKDAKSDAGFCTGSDTGSDGVFPEDNISDTSSAMGDKKEPSDCLMETTASTSSRDKDSPSARSSPEQSTTDTEYTYDKAIEVYKQFAENSAKKRSSSITSLSSTSSNTKTREETSSQTSSSSTVINEKLSLFTAEERIVTRRSTSREKTPKVDINKRRSMFELRDSSTQANAKPVLESSKKLTSRVQSFENILDWESKGRTTTAPKDTKFKEKLQSFTQKEHQVTTPTSSRTTPQRDENFHKKLQNFSQPDPYESKSAKIKNSLVAKTSLKQRIASFERKTPERDGREKSVSMECLSKVDTKTSTTNLVQMRAPSTPYMVVEFDNREENNQNVSTNDKRQTVYEDIEKYQLQRETRTAPIYSIFNDTNKIVAPETDESDSFNPDSLENETCFDSLTESIHSDELTSINHALNDTLLLNTDIPPPHSFTNAPPEHNPYFQTDFQSSNIEQMSYTEEFGDAEIDEVILDYELLSDATTAVPESAQSSDVLEATQENVYEKICEEEPAYENIYEKVDESRDGQSDLSLNHEYQTLDDVKKQVEDLSPPLPPKKPFKIEVMDVTWTEDECSASRQAPPSVPPPPPPTEGDEIPSEDSTTLQSSNNCSSPPHPIEKDHSSMRPSHEDVKKEIRLKRSSFLGTTPHDDQELTLQPPPDMKELLRQERDAERQMIQNQTTKDYQSSFDFLGSRSKYTWEDRVIADTNTPQDTSDSGSNLEFQCSVADPMHVEVSAETVCEVTQTTTLTKDSLKMLPQIRYDDIFTKKITSSHKREELKETEIHLSGSDYSEPELIPEVHLSGSPSVDINPPTNTAPRQPPTNIDYYNDLTNKDKSDFEKLAELELEMEKHDRHMLQRITSSNDRSAPVPASFQDTIPSQPEEPPLKVSAVSKPLPIQEFYTAPTYEVKKPNLSYDTKLTAKAPPPEPLPVGQSLLTETIQPAPPSAQPAPVTSNGTAVGPLTKQSIKALSAIPKPKLVDNDSWIAKRKPDASKRNYNNHWLYQEAEQRRLDSIPPKTTNFHQQAYQPPLVKPSVYGHTELTNSPVTHSHSFVSSHTSQHSHPPLSHSYSESDIVVGHVNSNVYANIPGSYSHLNQLNNNFNSKTQGRTYSPPKSAISPPSHKPLPDAIIHTITQRVTNKNKVNTNDRPLVYTSRNNNSDMHHDYMNTEDLETKRLVLEQPIYGNNTGLHPTPTEQLSSTRLPNAPIQTNLSAPTAEEQRLLSVSGKKKCSHCCEELGRGAAMIIESLRLFYHIPCFKCCVCGIQLGNGSSGADVRVRNHKLHCHNCYSNDEGMKFSKV